MKDQAASFQAQVTALQEQTDGLEAQIRDKHACIEASNVRIEKLEKDRDYHQQAYELKDLEHRTSLKLCDQQSRELLECKAKLQVYEQVSKQSIAPTYVYNNSTSSTAQNNSRTINQQQVNMGASSNTSFPFNLKPVTDEVLKDMTKTLHEKPKYYDSLDEYVFNMSQNSLKDKIVSLDASRHKMGWIDGDQNNQFIKDVNGVLFANKFVEASEENIKKFMSILVEEGKCENEHSMNHMMKIVNISTMFAPLQKNWCETNKSHLQYIGKAFAKSASSCGGLVQEPPEQGQKRLREEDQPEQLTNNQ